MGSEIVFVPFTPLKVYTSPLKSWTQLFHIFQAHEIFKCSGLPNF